VISRVAESCFWLHRYIERAESMARMLEVNRAFVLDADLPELQRWRPAIIVCGEEKRFLERFGRAALDDGEAVQRYLCWDEQCPVSIQTSVRWARENARTIREALSQELWETLNAFWLWHTSAEGHKLYDDMPYDFYGRVKELCFLFHGVCHNTMLHEEAFDFMRLGMQLERAGQTARLLDVHHHALGRGVGDGDGGGAGVAGAADAQVETAQWLAILRSCSASDASFQKSRKPLSGPAIAQFLLLEEGFPRSVWHCVTRAWNFLVRIRDRAPRVGRASAGLLGALVDSLRGRSINDILEAGLHDELTRIIDRTSEVCEAVHADYFDPRVPLAPAAPAAAAAPGRP
jgi:uncharacterized alpha-E superfamily protein